MSNSSLAHGTVTLREFVERVIHYIGQVESERWESHSKEHALLAASVRERDAVRAAKDEAQNEWRASMIDLRGTFIPRTELDLELSRLGDAREVLSKRITLLETALTRSQAVVDMQRESLARNQWLIGIGVTVVNVAIGVLLKVLWR